MVSKRWCKESKLEIPVNFHDQLRMFNRSVLNRSHAGENGRTQHKVSIFPGTIILFSQIAARISNFKKSIRFVKKLGWIQ